MRNPYEGQSGFLTELVWAVGVYVCVSVSVVSFRFFKERKKKGSGTIHITGTLYKVEFFKTPLC